jgi:hypothetical protein
VIFAVYDEIWGIMKNNDDYKNIAISVVQNNQYTTSNVNDHPG